VTRGGRPRIARHAAGGRTAGHPDEVGLVPNVICKGSNGGDPEFVQRIDLPENRPQFCFIPTDELHGLEEHGKSWNSREESALHVSRVPYPAIPEGVCQTSLQSCRTVKLKIINIFRDSHDPRDQASERLLSIRGPYEHK
jgi:hypothetical protein